MWGRLDTWASGFLYPKGSSGPSKVLFAAAWTVVVVLGPFVFIWTLNNFFGRDLPLTLWMPMSVVAAIILVVGWGARQVGLAVGRGR